MDTVDLDEELLYVARDLCLVAAAMFLLAAPDKAALQLEQAGDLLEERARIVSAGRARKDAELQ